MLRKFKFNHIGIALKDDRGISSFLDALGYKKNKSAKEKKLGVKIALYNKKNNPVIEIVTPYLKNEISKNIFKRYDKKIYHICFEVNSQKEIKQLIKKYRMVCVLKPTMTNIFRKKITYYYFKKIGLIEFIINE